MLELVSLALLELEKYQATWSNTQYEKRMKNTKQRYTVFFVTVIKIWRLYQFRVKKADLCKNKGKAYIPFAGGIFSSLGTAAGIFFSGTIFLGASGTLERLGLQILVCITEEVTSFRHLELTF